MSCETSCETVTGSIVALLDGELAEADRREVEHHLASCPACARELSEVEGTRRIVDGHLAAVAYGAGLARFDDLWNRVAADEPGIVRTPRLGGVSPRPASASRPARGGRRWLWAGASAGLALAAGLALLVFAPRPPEVTPGARDARSGKSAVVASVPAAKAVVAKSAQGSATRVAKSASDDAAEKPQVARRGEQEKAAPEVAAPADEQEAVAVNELDPPRDLLERPDLFLNYPIVRKLEELRHLDAVLADHGADDQPDDGGAG